MQYFEHCFIYVMHNPHLICKLIPQRTYSLLNGWERKQLTSLTKGLIYNHGINI